MSKKRTKISYTNFGDFPDMDTLKEIVLYGAKKGGNKRHLVFNNFAGEIQEKKFNETFYDATGIGQYLYDCGMAGKKVAILSENSYYWAICYYACGMSRLTCVPLDAKLTDAELTELMERSGCSAIIYTKDYASAIKIC